MTPEPNLDLGRPLRWADIRDPDSQPISDDDSGTFCYCCQEEMGFRQDELQPLTPSSGVFTRAILCQMEAPVYVCLDHVPFTSTEFEAFSPEVAALLKAARRQREVESRERYAQKKSGLAYATPAE